MQFSFELLRTPCDQFPMNTEHKQEEVKQEIHDEKKKTNICPKCNEKTISIFSQGDFKLSNDQQLSVVNDGLMENQQQQQYIPDELFQWVFQFLNAKELFTKIRFTCQRIDKIVCTSLLSLHCQGLGINLMKFAHEILPNETQLQELNLLANNIDDKEAKEIATIFPLMQQLQILNLSWNQIGNAGATAIAKSVKHLKQLQVLDISCNPIDDSGITAISNATKELTQFQQLEIYGKYSQDVYERMVEIFSQKRVRLNLNYCDVDYACAIALAKVLPHLTQLEQLHLGINQIGDTSATVLANYICNLTQLNLLNFDSNQIGDTGVTAIANSIINLTQLQVLYLSNNQIGDSGAIAIANSLSKLTRLVWLKLSNNQIGDNGATAIANAIGKFTRLNCLHLQNNNISEPVKQQLQEQFGDKLQFY